MHIIETKVILGIIKKLRNNKAVGIMNVSNEMVKYIEGEKMAYIIARILEM